MGSKNVVIFTQPRSGSTAFIKLFDNYNHLGEYLDNSHDKKLNVLRELEPYCFKYFPNHIGYDNWIDRKNTIVIVLIRNNMLARIASEIRLGLTNEYHIGNSCPSSSKKISKNKSIIPYLYFNHEKNVWRSDTESLMTYYIDSYEQFNKRVQLLKPDVIISYETLVEQDVLKSSGYKKLNKDPIELFFKDYTKAKEMVADIKPMQNKNIALLEDLLRVSFNG